MSTDQVIIVHLRQPKRTDKLEMRSDPFFEFGSFGCTKCHSQNLMNPKGHELEGKRIAFAQGGDRGFRLVLLTPPVRVVKHAKFIELRWEPAEMPFRYGEAPLLIDRDGKSDVPRLRDELKDVDRSTGTVSFSSAFRSRRTPVSQAIGDQLIRVYERRRQKAGPSAIASSYEESMPYPPNLVDTKRGSTFHSLKLAWKPQTTCRT